MCFKTQLERCLNFVLKIKTRVNVGSLFMIHIRRFIKYVREHKGGRTDTQLSALRSGYWGQMLHAVLPVFAYLSVY